MHAAAARPVVLVDGSNVARADAWRAVARADGDHELRRRLVDHVASWAASADVAAELAFDGAGPWAPGTTRVSAHVLVAGSGDGSGDALIERRAAALRAAGRPHWVVTDDRALRDVAGAGADRVLGCAAFVAELAGGAGSGDQGRGAAQTPSTRLADTLDADVRARFERLRRGIDD